MSDTNSESLQPFGVYRAKLLSADPAEGASGIDLKFQLADSNAQLTRHIPASMTSGDADALFVETLTRQPISRMGDLALDQHYGQDFDLHIAIAAVPTPNHAAEPEPAPANDPHFEDLSKGEAHAEAGEYQEALACFMRILESDSNHSEAYNNVGAVCWQLGKPDEARNFLEKALQCDPTHENAFYNLIELAEQTLSRDDLRFLFVKYQAPIPELPDKIVCRRRLFGLSEVALSSEPA